MIQERKKMKREEFKLLIENWRKNFIVESSYDDEHDASDYEENFDDEFLPRGADGLPRFRDQSDEITDEHREEEFGKGPHSLRQKQDAYVLARDSRAQSEEQDYIPSLDRYSSNDPNVDYDDFDYEDDDDDQFSHNTDLLGLDDPYDYDDDDDDGF